MASGLSQAQMTVQSVFWDVQTGEAISGPFTAHTHFVTSVAVSPDGKHIVSGSEDKTICVWDVQIGKAFS